MPATSGKHKLVRVKVLMVLSMVLLLCFLAYWLRAQYFASEAALKKDLNQVFARSVNDVTDSLLLGKVIRPILERDRQVKFKVWSDTTKNMKEREYFELVTDTVLRRDRLQRRIITTSGVDRKTVDIIKQIEDSVLLDGMDMMQRGIKIMIRQISDSSSARLKLDTTSLRNNFLNKLRSDRPALKVTWLKSGDEANGIVVTEDYAGKRASMLVRNYRGYLLKGILPETLFALLLLSAIATAFLSMYRGLIAQQKLSTMQSDLVSNMTHELKTPIATVKVALEALDSYGVINNPQTSKEYLGMAVSEIERLELLVNQALTSSLLESGNMSFQFERYDLLALINQTIKTMQIKLDMADAQISVATIGDNFIARIDKLHIQGVLINLLDNSIKYANRTPVIVITLEDLSDRLLLTVKDNGPGIPARYIDKVFDKFFRVPTGPVHNTRGYGLGLSYAKQVVEQHGGSITVSNAPEAGCTFTVSLPKSLS